MCNQRLAHATRGKPGDVVGWLVAVQAQDYAGAKWALGLRSARVTDDDVEQAFNQGTILRTHLLRPTWHFVTPADIRWLLALASPRVHAANAYMYRKLGLDSAIFKRTNAALAKALRGGRQLTRDDLRGVLQKAGIETAGELRMGYLLMQAELDALTCSGPRRGKQFTYALLDERVPRTKILERGEALAELARRYFVSRGPATVHDFAKWSGLTIGDASRGLEAVKAELRQETLDGRTYWLPASAPPAKERSATAHLLSIYDEYVSGYKDRSAICSPDHAARLSAMGNALSYIILLDGRIVGSWTRTLRKNEVGVEMNLFTRLTNAQQRAVAAACRRYGEYLGLPVKLSR